MKILTINLFVCIFGLIPFNKLYSQDTLFLGQHPFIKYEAKVNLSPKIFLLITTLSVETTNDTIEVIKDRQYTSGGCYNIPLYSGHLFLEKKIQNCFVGIIINSFNHLTYNPDYELKQNVIISNPVKDTINLGMIYPFEVGDYRVIAKLKYFYRGSEYTASSEYYYFTVNYLPKNSFYNK